MVSVPKMNCWEFMKCGREPGGATTGRRGVCCASTDPRLDGVHGGKNAGRACWVLAGTLCHGKTQGTFAARFDTCKECNFYRHVRDGEYPDFKLVGPLLQLLDEPKE